MIFLGYPTKKIKEWIKEHTKTDLGPLCFTAEEPNVKTTFNVDGGWPEDFNYLNYSTDGNTWNDYTGQEITLASIGDKVYFNTPDGTTNHSWGNNYQFRFKTTGLFAASGNIMSLVVKDGLTDVIPEEDYYFYELFAYCTSLTSAPALPATTLYNYCYNSMFSGCTSLTSAPALPATTLASGCYGGMFSSCTSLTSAPALPATTLVDSCYRRMFSSCTSLTSAPALPATTLASDCYFYMFKGCKSLTSAPVLPATTLVNNCYQYMFNNCTSLTSAPALPATTLASGCYSSMFYGCSNLSSIEVNHIAWNPTNATPNWVNGVSSTGTFKCPSALPQTRGINYIPTGWTIVTK